MANYLVAKCGNTTSSYSLRNEIPSSGPYLRVSNGYLPLTTDTKTGIQVKVNNKVYNIQESYTTTINSTTTYSIRYTPSYNTTMTDYETIISSHLSYSSSVSQSHVLYSYRSTYTSLNQRQGTDSIVTGSTYSYRTHKTYLKISINYGSCVDFITGAVSNPYGGANTTYLKSTITSKGNYIIYSFNSNDYYNNSNTAQQSLSYTSIFTNVALCIITSLPGYLYLTQIGLANYYYDYFPRKNGTRTTTKYYSEASAYPTQFGYYLTRTIDVWSTYGTQSYSSGNEFNTGHRFSYIETRDAEYENYKFPQNVTRHYLIDNYMKSVVSLFTFTTSKTKYYSLTTTSQ